MKKPGKGDFSRCNRWAHCFASLRKFFQRKVSNGGRHPCREKMKMLPRLSLALSVVGLLSPLFWISTTPDDGTLGFCKLVTGVILWFALMFVLLSWRESPSKVALGFIVMAIIVSFLCSGLFVQQRREYHRRMLEKTLERHRLEMEAKEQPSPTPLPNQQSTLSN